MGASGVDEGLFAPFRGWGGSARSDVDGAQVLLFRVLVMLQLSLRFLLRFLRMALEPHAGEDSKENQDR